MYYLITDQEGKDWRGRLWAAGVSHTEENENYHFAVYNSPLVAVYMYPAYEGIKNPKLWLCSGDNPSVEDGLRSSFATLSVQSLFTAQFPTVEQHITFGVLCAMNLVMNPVFREWGLKYLRGEDTSKESAQAVMDTLLATLDQRQERESAAFAALSAVLLDDAPLFGANAAHRAYWDAYDLPTPLDLAQTAQIVSVLSPVDIAGLLA